MLVPQEAGGLLVVVWLLLIDQAQKLLGALPPGKQQFAGAHDRKQAALLLDFVLRFTYLFLSIAFPCMSLSE